MAIKLKLHEKILGAFLGLIQGAVAGPFASLAQMYHNIFIETNTGSAKNAVARFANLFFTLLLTVLATMILPIPFMVVGFFGSIYRGTRIGFQGGIKESLYIFPELFTIYTVSSADQISFEIRSLISSYSNQNIEDTIFQVEREHKASVSLHFMEESKT